jgi:DNA-directed RNA polymerase specialized sigma24 family protein
MLAQVLSYHARVLSSSYSDLQTQDIEDLIHDVLLKLQSVAAIRRLRAARSVDGYLFVILRNAANDLIRRRKSEKLIEGDIIEFIDEVDRQVFEMRFRRNMSVAEIASDTYTSYSAVAAKLFKTLSRLRLQLADIEATFITKNSF